MIEYGGDSAAFLVFLIIGVWLAAPVGIVPAGLDFLHGVAQEEPWQTDTANAGVEIHRAKRQLSLQAQSATAGADAISAAFLWVQTPTKIASRTTVKLYRLTEVYLC